MINGRMQNDFMRIRLRTDNAQGRTAANVADIHHDLSLQPKNIKYT